MTTYQTELIGGDGNFNVGGLEQFMTEVNLSQYELSYAVVSIMGAQSSGKSTLLNKLFETKFAEMDASKGRRQTTRGVWLSNYSTTEQCTLVMDLEGTDGTERAEEDNTSFEKQSALFALAVSDIVLINIWCNDIGRDQAANKPLLKTVFQVMLRLFNPRKITLMFVIRDKTEALEILEEQLREFIEKIWDSVTEPEVHKGTPLSKFFNVEVVALSSFRLELKEFKEQVDSLRQRFFHSIAPGGLAGDRRGIFPASGFSVSSQQIWKTIKENKDLDLPSQNVMLATVRCEEIAHEKFTSFTTNEAWCLLKDAVQSGPVSCFGEKLSSILNNYLSEYDSEATYFDEGVRSLKRNQLKDQLLRIIQPAFDSMLGHIRRETLENFKEAFNNALTQGEWFCLAASRCTKSYMETFDNDCAKDCVVELANWDVSKVRVRVALQHDMDDIKLSKLKTRLNETLPKSVAALLNEANNNTWQVIRALLSHETKKAISDLSASAFISDLVATALTVKDYARGVVEATAKEEAERVVTAMTKRFTAVFYRDTASSKKNLKEITEAARSESLKVLAVMAAIRLDGENDNIENTLLDALGDSENEMSDQLTSSSWEQVASQKTLITPAECLELWTTFKAETKCLVTNGDSYLNDSSTISELKRAVMDVIITISTYRREVVDSLFNILDISELVVRAINLNPAKKAQFALFFAMLRKVFKIIFAIIQWQSQKKIESEGTIQA